MAQTAVTGAAMLGKAREGWSWFVEGLVEALLWIVDRTARAAPSRIEIHEGAAIVTNADGRPLGRLDPAQAPPVELARGLTGAPLDLVVPSAWMLRRDLDPVAVQSRPFLDAFVRHQIERVTPWRVGDTHYRILERPLPDDANRVAVAVVVVPKRLVAPWLAVLEPLHPGALRLRLAGDGTGEGAITLGGGQPRRAAALRRGVLWGLAASTLLVAVAVGWLQWQTGLLRDDIDAQDSLLAERKAVLARARRGQDPGGEAVARLQALRQSRALAVGVIDALSAALPDSAHLTALSIDHDHLTVAGVSTDPSGLVPALETSGAFAAVTFGAATTRVETGDGDRFSLEMRALPPRSDHAALPAGAVPAGAAP